MTFLDQPAARTSSIPYINDSYLADEFFKQFVYNNTNIFMVQCGHVDAEFRQVSKNDAGLPVHEILVNYQ